MREETDGFCHSGLEEAAEAGVGQTMCGKGLPKGEEEGEGSKNDQPAVYRRSKLRLQIKGLDGLIAKANVVTCERPSVVVSVDLVAERKSTPDQWIINAARHESQETIPRSKEGRWIRTYTQRWFETERWCQPWCLWNGVVYAFNRPVMSPLFRPPTSFLLSSVSRKPSRP